MQSTEIDSMDSSNWLPDYGYVEEVDYLHLSSGFPHWPAPTLDHSSSDHLSPEVNCASGDSGSLKLQNSRKRACREKMRRDRLNERFLELSSILEPGKPPKPDKAFVLGDAVRTVIQLRTEKEELKELNGQLQEKIKELKAEKNELKDEKQRLKEDKEKLEQQVKAMAAGHKLIPYIGFPGVAMWQFMSPAVVDTSQDHVLRPPVA